MSASVFVSGDRKAVMCAVDSATVIAKGDLVWLDTDDVKPFSDLPDVGAEAANQAAARDLFMGVALRSSASGETLAIPVATAGVFEFDCVSATFELGALVGSDGTGSGGNVGVSNSVVVAVATGGLAIGRVYKRGTSVVRVQVEIASAKMLTPIDDTTGADTVSELTATNGVVVDGVRLKDGKAWETITVASTTSATPTITAANMLGGAIVATTQSTSTVTLDSGTALDTAITSIVGTGSGFYWSIINSNSGTMTITANTTGNNLTGLNTLATNVIGRFFTYRTGTNAWATIRVS